MPAAPFLDSPRFTDAVAYGYVGGPGYLTSINQSSAGREQRIIVRSQSLGKWEMSVPLRGFDEASDLQSFFHVVQGRGYGFRFKDWLDYTVDSTSGRLAGGDRGTGRPTAQLQKMYKQGTSWERYRDIRKPVAGFKVYRAGVLQALTSDYTVDEYGLLTWVPDATRVIAAISKANPGVIRTSTGYPWSNGAQVYLSSIGGMVELNDTVVTLTQVDADEFSIGINTTGYTTYTSGGTVAYYPQASETLYWEGEFDVAARFGSDEMQMEIRDEGVYFLDGLPIVEYDPYEE